jgi:hypothetical protein
MMMKMLVVMFVLGVVAEAQDSCSCSDHLEPNHLGKE